MNLTDGRVTRTPRHQPDYAENNTIEQSRESLREVGTAISKRTHRRSPGGRGQCGAGPSEIALVRLSSKNEFNINWVTLGQFVIALKPLSGAACMAYELIRHLRLY